MAFERNSKTGIDWSIKNRSGIDVSHGLASYLKSSYNALKKEGESEDAFFERREREFREWVENGKP